MKYLYFFSLFFIVSSSFAKISNDSIIKIAGEKNEHIIDFEFDQYNQLVQLIQHNKDYYITLTTSTSEILKTNLKFKPFHLFKDSKKELYILSEDFVYPLNTNQFEDVSYRFSMEEFTKTIGPLIVNNQYFNISEKFSETKSTYTLYSSNDPLEQYLIVDFSNNVDYVDYFQVNRQNPTSSKKDRYYPTYLKERPTSYISVYHINKVNKESAYASFSIDSLIYTFDFLNHKILTVHPLMKNVYQIPLKLINQKHSKVVIDEIGRKFYLITYNGNNTIISLINLSDGSIETKEIIEDLQELQDCKVQNGTFYFTKRIDTGFKKLYSLKI